MRSVRVLLFVLLSAALAAAKDVPTVVVWPSEQQPVLRFSFGKFSQVSSNGRQHFFNSEVTAENLWGKRIPEARFHVYFMGKDKARIGEGYISLSNVAPHESIKFTLSFGAVGMPATFKLVATSVPPELQAFAVQKTISMTVYSVPSGANLKVDGNEVGTTPKLINVTPGKHNLQFAKEGYNAGAFPLEIRPDDVSGGSVTYELGALAQDTIELRDGSVINGDLQSVTPTEVLVRIGGKVQTIDRNQVKRILLVQREAPPPEAVTVPPAK